MWKTTRWLTKQVFSPSPPTHELMEVYVAQIAQKHPRNYSQTNHDLTNRFTHKQTVRTIVAATWDTHDQTNLMSISNLWCIKLKMQQQWVATRNSPYICVHVFVCVTHGVWNYICKQIQLQLKTALISVTDRETERGHPVKLVD